MRTLTIAFVLIQLVLAGCAGTQPTREASILVDVFDDQGRALSGVAILIDDTPVATTDKKGHARAVVQAAKHGKVRVLALCPERYREAEGRTVALARADAQAAPFVLRMTCAPKLRTLAVVVRAPGGEGLTLRADGAPVAKVTADGTAHVLLERAPETSLRLSLDTATAPKLLPQFPAREVQVTDRDEIVVFDQPLVLRSKPARRAIRKQVPVVEKKHVPYAIGRSN